MQGPHEKRGQRFHIALASAVLILLLWVVRASAQPMIGECAGVTITQDGVMIGCASILDLAAADYDCSSTSTGVSCNLKASVSKLGTCIGEATDFCGTVTFTGKTVDRTGATNIDGTIYGGTTTTSALKLDPSNAANYTSAVKVCNANPNIGTTSGVRCLSLFSDGLTFGTVLSAISGLAVDSTFTQIGVGSFGFPIVTLFDDKHLQVTSDSSLNINHGGFAYSFVARPTLRNATDDAQDAWGFVGFSTAPIFDKTGSGTMSVANAQSFYSLPTPVASAGTGISSGVTVPTFIDYDAGNFQSVAGTLTTRGVFHAPAINAGTNRLQFYAEEQTVTGQTPSNSVAWGAESGSPGRFVVQNESGHLWRMGYAAWYVSTVPLSTTATENFPLNGSLVAVNATDTSVDSPVPGAIHVYAMACGLETAPTGATKSRTFTLRRATPSAADSTLTCQITDTAKSCTVRVEAGVAYAAGDMLVIKSTVANTPSASTASCSVYYNIDAF